MTTTATSTDLTTLDAGGPSGAVWSLPHGGDLDANGVVLHPGDTVGAHANAEVDVIIVGISGTGEVTIDDSASSLTSGTSSSSRRVRPVRSPRPAMLRCAISRCTAPGPGRRSALGRQSVHIVLRCDFMRRGPRTDGREPAQGRSTLGRRLSFSETFANPGARLYGIVFGAGFLGGCIGAAYLAVLHLLQRGLWPTHWGWSHTVPS